MCTHNLCFIANIRKKCIPLLPVLLYKSGMQGGFNYTGMWVHIVLYVFTDPEPIYIPPEYSNAGNNYKVSTVILLSKTTCDQHLE